MCLFSVMVLSSEFQESSVAPRNEGAFPSDTPKAWNGGGRRYVEVDLYGGPSWANSGGFGLGANLNINDLRATEDGFGLNWEASFGGGFYSGRGGQYGAQDPRQRLQGQLVGGGGIAGGYYGIEGLKDGLSPHALLEFAMFEITVIGDIEQMYSYNPSIEVGIHGRNDREDASWFINLLGGAQLSYVRGDLEKLRADGSVDHWLFAPAAALEATADQRLTDTSYLRFMAIVSNTFDSLGPYGYRNIFQVIANAYIKIGSTLYTGPSFLYTNQEKTAATEFKTYRSATPEYSISWLLGGSLAAF